jgi:hypothetical protein
LGRQGAGVDAGLGEPRQNAFATAAVRQRGRTVASSIPGPLAAGVSLEWYLSASLVPVRCQGVEAANTTQARLIPSWPLPRQRTRQQIFTRQLRK